VKPYILGDDSAIEYQRLDLMLKILDPWTRGYLIALGVAEGWHCLELGGGTGSITVGGWLLIHEPDFHLAPQLPSMVADIGLLC
jgi:hypothetical protein